MDLDKKHHSYESDGRGLVISQILPEDDVMGRENGHQRVPHPHLRGLGICQVAGEREINVVDGFKVANQMTLKQGNCFGLSAWVSHKEGGRKRESEGDVTKEEGPEPRDIASFENSGRGHTAFLGLEMTFRI